MSKVLVGCPTSSHKAYCLEEYSKAIKSLTYSNYGILLVDNSENLKYVDRIRKLGIDVVKDNYFETARERVVHSRNLLRDYVLKNNYDYFLSLEQDVIPPKDVIERLLRHDKKVVTGIYFTRYDINGKKKIKPLIWVDTPGKFEKMKFIDERELWKSGLIKIRACGLGCVLIHKSVLESISFRLFKPKIYDDMAFCHDLYKKGISIYADLEVKCKHLISGMDWDSIKE